MIKNLITKIFKRFCKETGRGGGILVHSSIGEWHEYLAKNLDNENKPDNSPASSVTDNRFAGDQDSVPQLDGSDSSKNPTGGFLWVHDRSHNLSKLL